MASTNYFSNAYKSAIMTGDPGDWDNDSFRTILMNGISELTATQIRGLSGYTAASAYEISGTGYTATGQALTATLDDTTDATTPVVDGTDVQWTSSTLTADACFIYNDTDASDLGILTMLFDAEETTSNGTFTLGWNASGIFDLATGTAP